MYKLYTVELNMENLNELKVKIIELEMNSNDIETSTKNYKNILELIKLIPENDMDYELKKSYARALLWNEKYEESYDKIIEVENTGKNDDDWYCTIAHICFNLQNYEKAIEYINIAIKICGNNESYKNLLELYSNFV